MDPLDGSSNIDVAVSIGSIFGIWRREPGENVTAKMLLSPGEEQFAAVYAVYGSSTVLVVATIAGVDGFTLDPSTGAFELTHPDIRFPAKCQYYSMPDGYYKRWDERTRERGNLSAGHFLAAIRRLARGRLPP